MSYGCSACQEQARRDREAWEEMFAQFVDWAGGFVVLALVGATIAAMVVIFLGAVGAAFLVAFAPESSAQTVEVADKTPLDDYMDVVSGRASPTVWEAYFIDGQTMTLDDPSAVYLIRTTAPEVIMRPHPGGLTAKYFVFDWGDGQGPLILLSPMTIVGLLKHGDCHRCTVRPVVFDEAWPATH